MKFLQTARKISRKTTKGRQNYDQLNKRKLYEYAINVIKCNKYLYKYKTRKYIKACIYSAESKVQITSCTMIIHKLHILTVNC